MTGQVRNALIWLGAALAVIAATLFYQPAAAKTGTLLVWTNDRLYTMDIDTLLLQRLAPVGPDEVIAPAPGCFGHVEAPCWVVAGQRLILVNPDRPNDPQTIILPIGQGNQWLNSAVVWSPDGHYFAYAVRNQTDDVAEWRIYNTKTQAIELALTDINPELAPAWSTACQTGLTVPECRVAYLAQEADKVVVAYAFADGRSEQWQLAVDQLNDLRWHWKGQLLFSPEPRHYYQIENGEPAFELPAGGQLADISPDGRYTVYYQPFTIDDCDPDTDACLYLGVWLKEFGSPIEPKLLYQLRIGDPEEGLNFIPVWSPDGNQVVFFQNGRLIHYDLDQQEGLIWYRPVRGKLRSLPIFSPFEPAVAFVDNQGQGFSEYRLLVINPKLQPIIHILETDSSLRLLSWLPW